jgi:hypothetical protein
VAGAGRAVIVPPMVIPWPARSGSNTARYTGAPPSVPSTNVHPPDTPTEPTLHVGACSVNPVRMTSNRLVSRVSSLPMMSRASRFVPIRASGRV